MAEFVNCSCDDTLMDAILPKMVLIKQTIYWKLKMIKKPLVKNYQKPEKFWKYCKFGNFCENFIFVNSVERNICDVKIWANDMLNRPKSVNDRVILPVRKDFIFT